MCIHSGGLLIGRRVKEHTRNPGKKYAHALSSVIVYLVATQEDPVMKGG